MFYTDSMASSHLRGRQSIVPYVRRISCLRNPESKVFVDAPTFSVFDIFMIACFPKLTTNHRFLGGGSSINFQVSLSLFRQYILLNVYICSQMYTRVSIVLGSGRNTLKTCLIGLCVRLGFVDITTWRLWDWMSFHLRRFPYRRLEERRYPCYIYDGFPPSLTRYLSQICCLSWNG